MPIPRIPDGAAQALTLGQHRALENFYGALGRHNVDLLDEATTPDWEDIPLAPGQGPGPEGAKPVFRMLLEAFPDLAVEIVDVLAERDRAAVRALVSATHAGPLFGVPASGRRVSFVLHEFHDFQGDRLRRTWHLEDLFGLFTQAGAFPSLAGEQAAAADDARPRPGLPLARGGAGLIRALLINGYATVPTAHLGTAPDARPGPGEVRVRVEAAALNPLDAKLAHGDMKEWFPLAFPYVPGTDFAGEVIELGEGVTDLRLGDAVLGRSEPAAGGALAEAVVVPARSVTRRAEGLDAATAACLPTPAGIAHQALFDHLHVLEGTTLLVLGAGGAVGRAAVQLAPAGIEVVACADRQGATASASLARWVRPDEPDVLRAAAAADCVLDCAGGELQRRVVAKMRPGTKLAAIVTPADEAATSARGIEVAFLVLETRPDTLAAIADAATRGILRPAPLAVFGFEEAAATYRGYVAGRRTGKLVMTNGGGR